MSWPFTTGDLVSAADLNNVFPAGNTFTDWSASLEAVTTDPTTGSGGAEEGRYIRMGDKVWARFHYHWGSGGSGGTGIYFLSLPVNARLVSNMDDQVVGYGFYRDASALQRFNLWPYLTSTSVVRFRFGEEGAPGAAEHGTLSVSDYPSASAPGGNGDDIVVTMEYEVA